MLQVSDCGTDSDVLAMEKEPLFCNTRIGNWHHDLNVIHGNPSSNMGNDALYFQNMAKFVMGVLFLV
jgi:hypothetical protein